MVASDKEHTSGSVFLSNFKSRSLKPLIYRALDEVTHTAYENWRFRKGDFMTSKAMLWIGKI
jgi:hypothetical protein